jgi:hypothetical protein
MLTRKWDEDAWPKVKAELRKALAFRSAVGDVTEVQNGLVNSPGGASGSSGALALAGRTPRKAKKPKKPKNPW